MKQLIPKYQYGTASVDKVRVNRIPNILVGLKKQDTNPELQNGIQGVQLMNAWRTRHPRAAKLGDLMAAAPIVIAASPAITHTTIGGLTGGTLGGIFDSLLGLTKSFNKYAGIDLPEGTIGGFVGGLGLGYNSYKNIPVPLASPMKHSISEYLNVLRKTLGL